MPRYLAAILVIAAATWALWPASDSAPQDDNPLHKQLVDRAWIDQMPVYPEDKIDFLFLDSDSQIGVFQNVSVYEGDYSLFAWHSRKNSRFDLTWLQHRSDHRVTYRVSKKGCGEFDLCMTVEGAPRGARKYFSMADWGDFADSDAAVSRVKELLADAEK